MGVPPSSPAPGIGGQADRQRSVSEELRRQALALGFEVVGIAPATRPNGADHLQQWLQRGFAGEMSYMHGHAAAREHPRHILEGARSLVMVGMNYQTREPPETGPLQGRVSRYAWGEDYHRTVKARLRELHGWLQERVAGCRVRTVVDTAPLMERDFAQLAGLGWIGKNTMLINKSKGSWLFLGALLTDVALDYDRPHAASHCGSCTRCLDACPTGAFAAPYELDSRRCISYLTIELRGAIPEALRGGVGHWVFGCDVCQDVCPWNRKAPRSPEGAFSPRPDSSPLDLMALLQLDAAAFRLRFRDSAMNRPKRAGLLRNAAIALGNGGDARAVPVLANALSDPEALVRGAAAWALGKMGTSDARAALQARIGIEEDATVKAELAAAMQAAQDSGGCRR